MSMHQEFNRKKKMEFFKARILEFEQNSKLISLLLKKIQKSNLEKSSFERVSVANQKSNCVANYCLRRNLEFVKDFYMVAAALDDVDVDNCDLKVDENNCEFIPEKSSRDKSGQKTGLDTIYRKLILSKIFEIEDCFSQITDTFLELDRIISQLDFQLYQKVLPGHTRNGDLGDPELILFLKRQILTLKKSLALKKRLVQDLSTKGVLGLESIASTISSYDLLDMDLMDLKDQVNFVERSRIK